MFDPAKCSCQRKVNISGAKELHFACWASDKRWRSKEKTMIAALAPRLLAAGPVFAQGSYVSPSAYLRHSGYGINPNNPAITGGGSFGHNRLLQAF
jgi:hypothetical protein